MGRRFTDGQPRTVAPFICVPAGTHVFSHYSGFSAGGASVQRGFNFFDAGGHIPFQFVDPETQNSPSGGRDLRIAPVVVEFSVAGARRVPTHAVEFGRAYAKMLGAEHKIHNMNGRIASGDSYGNDPFPPRG